MQQLRNTFGDKVSYSYLMLYLKDTLKEIILYNPNVIFQVWEILKDITVNDIDR